MPRKTAASPPLTLSVIQHRLANGLTVLIAPDHALPAVGVAMRWRVGTRDDGAGRSGLTDLVAFTQGTATPQATPGTPYTRVLEAAGGQWNTWSERDTSLSYGGGPSNLLETFLWVEADRMASMAAHLDEGFLEAQRAALLDCCRQTDNAPYGTADTLLSPNLYPAGHPYQNDDPLSAELATLTLADVQTACAAWYGAGNAILAVAGAVDPAEVLRLAERHFGGLPAGSPPVRAAVPDFVLPAVKQVPLTDQVPASKLILAWPSPPLYSQGDADCELLAQILATGKASRLYQRLVQQAQLATQVGASQYTGALQGSFELWALAQPGLGLDGLRAAVDEELARLVAAGPTPAEVASARNRCLVARAQYLESPGWRAYLMGGYHAYLGNADRLQQDLARYAAATPDSLRAAAAKLFVPGRLELAVNPEGAK